MVTECKSPTEQDGRADRDDGRPWPRISRREREGRAEGQAGQDEDRDAAAGKDYSGSEDVRRDEIIRYAVVYSGRGLIWALAVLAIVVLVALVIAAVMVIWTAVSPESLEVVPDEKMTRVISWASNLGPHISFVSGSTLTLAVVAFARWWSRRGS